MAFNIFHCRPTEPNKIISHYNNIVFKTIRRDGFL